MLDVVVEFSSVITNDSLAFYKQPATYEGRAVPGSPFVITVAPNPNLKRPQNMCRRAELGTAPGSWVLTNVSDDHAGPVDFTTANFSWLPDTCKLPGLDCIVAASKQTTGTCLGARRTVMVYAIGDSVTRVQAQSLANLLGEVIRGEGETYIQETHNTIFDIHFQATNDGMIPRMVFIKQAIDRLAGCHSSGDCIPVIHFNSGLHDLDKYCGDLEHQVGFRESHCMGKDFDCIKSYTSHLQQVIDYVNEVGLDGIKIFRTTTAAWLKFGNHQVNWFSPDKREEQVFISNWLSVIKFNQLAVPVFEKAGWHIIDGFQSSIGRPDHAERTPGGALVHFDHEVPDAHNHQLLSIVFEELCPQVLSSCLNESHMQMGLMHMPSTPTRTTWKSKRSWLNDVLSLSRY